MFFHQLDLSGLLDTRPEVPVRICDKYQVQGLSKDLRVPSSTEVNRISSQL